MTKWKFKIRYTRDKKWEEIRTHFVETEDPQEICEELGPHVETRWEDLTTGHFHYGRGPSY